jgi:N-ethylmaleimide reductase
VTEGTAISPQGQGHANVPGLYTEEARAGWRAVADAVHARAGKIVVQLWHVGRISHTELQPGGARPVAPAVGARATMSGGGAHGYIDYPALEKAAP